MCKLKGGNFKGLGMPPGKGNSIHSFPLSLNCASVPLTLSTEWGHDQGTWAQDETRSLRGMRRPSYD